jgi:hypothetical protein
MRIAIIGPGKIGGGLGRLFARAGHDVIFTGSRHPEKLARAAELAGPNARTDRISDAVEEAGVVVMTVPFGRYADVSREVGPALRGQVVVDTSNPITIRDGQLEFLTVPDGVTAAQHQQRTLGPVRLVKAFNLICASQLDRLTRRTGDERVIIPYVGDDPAAKQAVATLIADAHFVPVDAGTLAEATALEPSSLAAWPAPRAANAIS